MEKYKELEDKYGVTINQLVDYCYNSPFPGTNKWPSNHPIWDCYLPGKPSPKEAWDDKHYLRLAVENLFWILDKSIRENKYETFVEKHEKAFNSCVIKNNSIIYSDKDLVKLILNRFTIAKIAPKVTALNANRMYQIMEESGLDFSCGVYAPMAGFGGIIEAAKMWFTKHNIPTQNNSYNYLIEAFDINSNFCSWYGWTQKDMLFEKVKTNKIVVVCPPFGNNYEHWKGTPDEMSDISFLEWYFLIKDFIDAPNYLIIGPEIKGKENQKCGLFKKTTGIQLWTDEMYKKSMSTNTKY